MEMWKRYRFYEKRAFLRIFLIRADFWHPLCLIIFYSFYSFYSFLCKVVFGFLPNFGYVLRIQRLLGSSDIWLNAKGSNDIGLDDQGSNDKRTRSKTQQREEQHRVKKCDKRAKFHLDYFWLFWTILMFIRNRSRSARYPSLS